MRRQGKTCIFLLICLGILALGCAGFQLYYFSVFTVDDAYISYQYAENFAKGDGLVFNKGEYVEGYTNFLWVIILGAAKKIGFDIPTTSLLAGAFFSVITLIITAFLSHQISAKLSLGGTQKWVHPVLSGLAVLCVATSPAFGTWAVAGLETPLFLCLLTIAVWLHLRERSQSEGFPFSSACFGLLALTRPEGILYFGLTCGYSVGYHLIFRTKFRVWNLWKSVGSFLCFVIPHFIWRWYYYGSLLPNTYYMKVGKEFYGVGLKYVYEFYFSYGGTGIFLLSCLFLIIRRLREYWVGYMLVLLGVSTAYFAYVGGDWMPEFRFFVPLLPLFFLCMQEGLREILRLLPKTHSPWTTPGIALFLLTMPVNNLFLFHKAPRIDSRLDGHVMIGELLQKHASPDDVLAAIDIGAMAYISGLRTIDYFGLADAHIARLEPKSYTFEQGFWGHHRLTLKSDIAYVLSHNPRFIELNTVNNPESTAQAVPADPYSELMWRHPTFRREYRPLFHTSGTTIFVKTHKP